MIWFLGNFPSHLIEKLRNIIIEFLIWRSIHFLESRLHEWEKNKSRCTYLTEIAKQIPNRTILSERASLINRKPSNQGIYCTRVTWVSVQDKNKIYELFNFSWVSAFNILLKTLCHWKKQEYTRIQTSVYIQCWLASGCSGWCWRLSLQGRLGQPGATQIWSEFSFVISTPALKQA